MERGTLLGRLSWQLGEAVATRPETARAKSITFDLPGWIGHRAGQHVDVRLTAEDGYQAERSYSTAYMHGMGTVIRCPSCDNVLIRVVHARGRYLLDMRGVRVLQIKEG